MFRRLSSLATVLSLTLTPVVHSAAAQDVRRGEQVYRRCLLCHVADPNAKDLLAPPLHNVLGRRAATVSGFDYSEIMRTAGARGLLWTAEALFHFLDQPESFMPGNYMAFSGLEERERRDVIAYLEHMAADWTRKSRTAHPVPQTFAQPTTPKHR